MGLSLHDQPPATPDEPRQVAGRFPGGSPGPCDRRPTEVRAGIDPIEDRKAATKRAPTFAEVADELIRSNTPAWKSPRSKDQWRQRLNDYAKPLALPIDKIDTVAVLGVLRPIWHEKPETASRVRGLIEAVCDYGRAARFRSGENPATWRGNLAHLLSKQRKLDPGHFAAMPYGEISAFVQALREYQNQSVAAYALELLILTGVRTNEVLGAKWSEIDVANAVWTIPKERMKTGREHRIPLSRARDAHRRGDGGWKAAGLRISISKTRWPT